jgi:cytoplasmic iron level regulating protein YaaA (DUF328/UPF0246 family)
MVMHVLLAPSKTMTMTRSTPDGIDLTEPHFIDEAASIVRSIRGRQDVAAIMHVSQPIAQQVMRMYDEWGRQTAPALFAYVGDVYRWFYADTLSAADLRWANDRLSIMSGLYGALRPTDKVSPYRLEMKAKIAVDGSGDIYEFWGAKIARFIDSQPGDVICNLSSDEYAKVVTKYTKKRIVTPVFMDKKGDGRVGTVPIYSKMMRGVMARWIIDNRIDEPDGLQEFAMQGYTYDRLKSTPDRPVFYREKPQPIRFP